MHREFNLIHEKIAIIIINNNFCLHADDLKLNEFKLIELKHVLSKYYFHRLLYDDKLFKAEKEIVKSVDMRIFGAAFWLLDTWENYKKRNLLYQLRLTESLNDADGIMKRISQSYLALVDKIESSSGAKIDNTTNRIIFDERLESLEVLQAVSGCNSSTFRFSSGADLVNYSEKVKTFPGMKKLVETFSGGIKEMYSSMHHLSLPNYGEEEMFPKDTKQKQKGNQNDQKGSEESKQLKEEKK